MEVKMDNAGTRLCRLAAAASAPTTRNLWRRNFRLSKRPRFSTPSIERLDLTKEFSPPGQRSSRFSRSISGSKDRCNSRKVRNTGLIEIGVFDTDAQRAANIANMIAVVYRERRKADLETAVDRGLEQLKDEVDKQRKVVEEASNKAALLRQEQGILDSDPDKEGSQVGGGVERVGANGQSSGERPAAQGRGHGAPVGIDQGPAPRRIHAGSARVEDRGSDRAQDASALSRTAGSEEAHAAPGLRAGRKTTRA